MTQKELDFLDSQDFMSSGAGFVYNPRHTSPQSQDAAGLDMGLYDHRSPQRKENFGIITTTLYGIMNSVNVLADEIRNHTSILLSKLEKRAKPSTSGACYICHQQGHWAPECPDRQSQTYIKPVFQMRPGRTLSKRLPRKSTSVADAAAITTPPCTQENSEAQSREQEKRNRC